jgi:hypothetical protein
MGREGGIGALFVEAKGHERELRGGGTKARDSGNLERIAGALHDVQNALHVQPGTNWLGPVYQPANRLAWLWFAREHPSHRGDPLPVWLVSIYFCGGKYPWGRSGKEGPVDEEAWRPHIDALQREMRVPEPPHELSRHCIELFLRSTVTELPT